MSQGLRRTLKRVFWRSMFIQAGWNFERLQNIGFAFAMQPALKRMYPDPQRYREALLRHLEVFNTHPYMATLVLGSTLKVEEEASQGAEGGVERVTSLKLAMMGPLAAIGDSFFWATLRPLAALVAVATAWMAPELGLGAAVAVYLGIFNLPHLTLRVVGLGQGYALGFEIAEFLRKVDTQGVIAALKLLAMVALGATLAAFGRFAHPASQAAMPFKDNFLFIGAGLAMLMALRLKFSVNKIFALLLLASLVLAIAFPNIH